jgi:hypothetical protein
MVLAAMALLGAGVLAGHIHHQHPSAALGATGTTVPVITLKGTVLARTASSGCSSADNGIAQGAHVNVANGSGAVLGSTTLGSGIPANHGGCTWAWSLTVPVAVGYQVQVGGLPVAGVSRTTLATQGWNLYLNDTTDSSNLINIESGV